MSRRITWLAVSLAALLGASSGAAGEETSIVVFDRAALEHDPDLPADAVRDGHPVRAQGQALDAVVDLPPAPADQTDARRIVATIRVEPVPVEVDGRSRPGDPWTRLGSLSLILPAAEEGGDPVVLELMRFVTGFGGPGEFTQDLTALAPLLHGQRTLRIWISTYMKPAWSVTVTLTYTDDIGYRRPRLAVPLFPVSAVTAEENRLEANVEIPPGLTRPRLRIITTGHATDGAGGDEFVTRTHVLRVDGREVVRWRPWSEGGAAYRDRNPTSWRGVVAGREIWSSDLDRTGWHPGAVVEPLLIPLPELSPGGHTVTLEVVDIRPRDADGAHGYWRVSGTIVVDEPWPTADGR